MAPKKITLHLSDEDGNLFSMCSPSRCGQRLVIHEKDEEKKRRIKAFTKNSDGILYEGEAVDKKTLAQKPTDRHVEILLKWHRHMVKKNKNEKSDTNMMISLSGCYGKQAPPMSWHRILLYLLLAAPVYIPIICYLAASVFDIIIDFLKGK